MKKIKNTKINVINRYIKDEDSIKKTINELEIIYDYEAKPALTEDFKQNINLILLWKINRDIKFEDSDSEEELKTMLDNLKESNTKIDFDNLPQNVEEILKKLIFLNGINLPVASAIINIYSNCKYPIYDQRAYRAVMALNHEEEYEKPKQLSNKKDDSQIQRYKEYLKELNVYLKKIEKENYTFKIKDQKTGNNKKTKINNKTIDQFLYQIDVLTNLKIDY